MVRLSVHALFTSFIFSIQGATVFAAPATETLKLGHHQRGKGMLMPAGGYREDRYAFDDVLAD